MAEKKIYEVDRCLIVTEPIVDLLRGPVDPTRYGQNNHDLQETQLLFNEILLYRGENDEWYQAEAIEQPDFSPEMLWRGYPGWVRKKATREVERAKKNNMVIKRKSAHVYKEPDQVSKVMMTVSIGTRFHGTGEIAGAYCQVSLPNIGNGWVMKRDTRSIARSSNEKQLRKSIVSTAKLFLGVPYLWGGRSLNSEARKYSKPGTRNPQEEVAYGVDCSGLTSLVFRANNIDIPRNAHVQWMVTPKITYDAMQSGDLIFVSKIGEFYTICHVMIFLGGDEFIEASETDTAVRINTFVDKFGKTLPELAKQGLIVDNRQIYCGHMSLPK